MGTTTAQRACLQQFVEVEADRRSSWSLPRSVRVGLRLLAFRQIVGTADDDHVAVGFLIERSQLGLVQFDALLHSLQRTQRCDVLQGSFVECALQPPFPDDRRAEADAGMEPRKRQVEVR